jgi:hypothetical protein
MMPCPVAGEAALRYTLRVVVQSVMPCRGPALTENPGGSQPNDATATIGLTLSRTRGEAGQGCREAAAEQPASTTDSNGTKYQAVRRHNSP